MKLKCCGECMPSAWPGWLFRDVEHCPFSVLFAKKKTSRKKSKNFINSLIKEMGMRNRVHVAEKLRKSIPTKFEMIVPKSSEKQA